MQLSSMHMELPGLATSPLQNLFHLLVPSKFPTEKGGISRSLPLAVDYERPLMELIYSRKWTSLEIWIGLRNVYKTN